MIPVLWKGPATLRTARMAVILATAMMLGVLWLLFGLWAYGVQTSSRENWEHILERQRITVSEHVEGVFRLSQVFLAQADRWIAENPGKDPRRDAGFAGLVADFQRITGQSMLVRLIQQDGSLHLVPEVNGAQAANVSDREYFKGAIKAPPGELFISAPFQGRSTGRWAVAVVTRLSSPSHGVALAMVALELSVLDNAFQRARLPQGGGISLVRSDGILLARSASRPSELGLDLSKAPLFLQGVTKAKEGLILSDGKMVDGIPKLVSYGALPTYPLIVTSSLALDAIQGESGRSIREGALLMLVVTLIGLFALYNILALLSRLAAEVEERSDVAAALKQSESDLRSILDNMVDVFYRADAEGVLVKVSPSVSALLGYEVEEAVGRSSLDFHYDADGRDRLLAAMRGNGMRLVDYEFRLRHRDGRPIWVAASAHALFDETGAFAGTEGIMRGIDERKEAERVLLENVGLTQALINASGDAIMLIRTDGTLMAVNQVMADRLGRTSDDLVGMCLWDLFPPEIAKARKDVTDQVILTGKAACMTDIRGGMHLDNRIYPVAWQEGRTDMVAVYSRDVTLQHQTEERIASYIAEVERSNGELEQFAYVASHDLREPLRMISSYLSLLERRYGNHLPGDGKDFLNYARDGAKRMDDLILDLLEFSRIGRRGDPIRPVPLPEAVTQALHHLSLAIADAGALISVAGTGNPMVMADQHQLVRLIQNLIGNAVKYRADGRRPEVTVTWTRRQDAWEIEVKDNGIGIEPQYFERIFGIFQRLHTREKYQGTGIGLAICKKIVERHDGRIWLDSVPGEGSTFHFTLPAADALTPDTGL